MQEYILAIIVVLIFHFGTINRISLFTETYARGAFFAPREVLISTYHLVGVSFAVAAGIIIVWSARTNILDYGIFVAGFLIIADVFLVYRALKIYG